MQFFIILITFTIFQRLFELRIATRNTNALIQKGAIEFGKDHYWMLVTLHTLFLSGMIVEFLIRRPHLPALWALPFALFALAQLGRIWVIRSMEGRWTTRILVLPDTPLVSKGPFRFVSHPNYWIVAIEILTLPLVFGLCFTSVIFSILNAVVLLGFRIPAETKALLKSNSSANSP